MTVADINAYGLVIGGSLVIILSYFANLLAKRTNIPSVLVLIGMGIALREGLNAMGLTSIPFESLVLELLGTIGLIFIVLEAALELDLTRDKMPLIVKSATMALLALLGSSAAIAAFLNVSMDIPTFEGWVYAIPLSIMSSAIIIPSVAGLDANDREFMVYESTFSDIFGIMAFYILLGNSNAESTNSVIASIGTNLVVTFVLAVIVSYVLVYVLQKITSSVKLFLSIAVLLLIYSIQKLLHLSPLVLILIFGLMLNNHRIFFPNWTSKMKRLQWLPSPAKLLDDHRMHELHRDYHLLTLETAFVIRTFFFVLFGMTVSLVSLTDLHVITEGLIICCVLSACASSACLLFQRKRIFPLLYIAPRGLITILLFFQIQGAYSQFAQPQFNQGILLVIILVTSIIMTIALVQNGITLRGVTLVPDMVQGEDDSEESTSDEQEDAESAPPLNPKFSTARTSPGHSPNPAPHFHGVQLLLQARHPSIVRIASDIQLRATGFHDVTPRAPECRWHIAFCNAMPLTMRWSPVIHPPIPPPLAIPSSGTHRATANCLPTAGCPAPYPAGTPNRSRPSPRRVVPKSTPRLSPDFGPRPLHRTDQQQADCAPQNASAARLHRKGVPKGWRPRAPPCVRQWNGLIGVEPGRPHHQECPLFYCLRNRLHGAPPHRPRTPIHSQPWPLVVRWLCPVQMLTRRASSVHLRVPTMAV